MMIRTFNEYRLINKDKLKERKQIKAFASSAK
jgi:hypothetical protein